tara:strand:- start:5565 stop:7337 length:1773 start_codon:yes stop_codon:yes gene_type:complete
MAVFRSDQSQLTYAMESSPGGDVELNNGSLKSSGSNAVIKGAVTAGTSQVEYDGIGNGPFVVGDMVRIGPGTSTSDAGSSTAAPFEVRRIVHGTNLAANDNTLYFDRPLGFNHVDNTTITEIDGSSTTQQAKIITEVPGVYESVTLPDLTPSYEPRYFLGVGQKRDWTKMYIGAQSFSGALPGFIPLNGKPLRWAIGDVFDVPSAVESASTDINGAVSKGDIYVTLDGSHGYSAGDFICFASSATIRTGTSVDDVNQEIQKIAAFPSTNVARLEKPFRFAHPDDSAAREVSAAATIKHHIVESVILDTMTWHAHMRDSSETTANDFDRRYVGGMVGSCSISGDEGGMLMTSWDSVQFLDMFHNQKEVSQSDVNPGSEAALTSLFNGDSMSAGLPRFTDMADISTSDANLPSTEPYYFSQGQVKIMGQEFARIRSFNLSISNGEEPRYYIAPRYGRHRGPAEIREGRRTYGLSCTLALPDSGASDTAVGRDTATEFFKQLLMEGNYGSGMEGFNIELTFTRGTDDSIQILIPADYTSGDETTGAEPGLGENGAFLTSAPHPISGDPIMQVGAEFSCRNLKIVVTDTEKVYT